MKYLNNADNPDIPKGKAMLILDNNGFVGTNNGWPLAGQSALYPESQAIAMAEAWNLLNFLGEEKVRELFPNPDGVNPAFWRWVFSDRTQNHNY